MTDGSVVNVLHPSSRRVEWKDGEGELLDYRVFAGPEGGPESLYVMNHVFADETGKNEKHNI